MFSITKMKALWELFQQGKSVADPHKWSGHQVSITMLAGFLLAVVQLCKAFNYDLPIDTDTATAIAGGILAVANTVMSIMGSKHLGLPTGASTEAQQALPSVQQSVVAAEAQEAVQPVNNAADEQPTGSSIDAATVERARAWAAEHSKQPDNDRYVDP